MCNPNVAGILSFFIPGVWQIYNGKMRSRPPAAPPSGFAQKPRLAQKAGEFCKSGSESKGLFATIFQSAQKARHFQGVLCKAPPSNQSNQ